MKLLARLGAFGALAVAIAAYPAVSILASGATEAYIVAAKSPAMVKFNQDSFEPRGPKEPDAAFHRRIMEVYGNAVDYTTPVLFVSKEKFIRPAEAPSLIILPVDKEKGENPLQVKSLHFFAKYVVIGASVAFAVLFGLSFLFGRKPPPSPTPAPR